MAVTVGSRTSLVSRADASIKPGNAAQGIFLQSAAVGITPVEITEVTNAGTTSAIATATTIDSNGDLIVGGQSFTDCLVIPYRQFATVGDKGWLATITVPNSAFFTDPDQPETIAVNFLFIARQAFERFTG